MTETGNRVRPILAILAGAIVFGTCQLGQIFGQSAVHSASMRRVADQENRTWTDNTGRHRVEGRLVAINSNHVRIDKTNGRYATVPLDRLSRGDRQFVAAVRRELKSAGAATDSSTFVSVVHIRISKKLLARIAQHRYHQDYPIDEVINDIPVSGTMRTVAQTDIRMVPNSLEAIIEIPVRGYSRSATSTDARVAIILGEGVTSFEKLIRITLSEDDIQIASGQLRSASRYTITGITTSFNRVLDRVVRNLVNRRVTASKDAFDRESERRERSRINDEIDARVRHAAGVVNQLVDLSIEAILKVRDKLQVQAQLRTTSDQLFVVLKQSVEKNPSKPAPAPEIAADVPFVAQIHTSVIRQSVTEAEVVASLKPVLNDFQAKQGGSLELIEQRIRNGRFKTTWSTDGEWLSVHWFPAADREPRSARK